MHVFNVFDEAVARAAEDRETLLAARSRWNTLAGEVHDEEPLYEERIAAFLEWFLIEHGEPQPRGAAIGSGAPIRRLIHESDDSKRADLIALATAHRGLFVVREHVPDGLVLEDLWGGARFQVYERRRLIGLGIGEIFEARLVADVTAPPRLLLMRGLCFHPREALRAIVEQTRHARLAGEPRDAFLFRLLRRRVQCERYRHLSPRRIYSASDLRDA